jgi:hypothetical protein
MLQFLQGGEQIGNRPAPAIQAPHKDYVDVPTSGGLHQFLTHLPLCSAGADFLHLHRDSPASPGGILAQSA